MDNILYSWLGVVTGSLSNVSAIRIQRAYRNRRDLKMRWRDDVIHNRVPVNDDDSDTEEMAYWADLRKKVKTESKMKGEPEWVCL